MIGLWGHSMGAVTSLVYGAEDPSIAGMVLDRPFSDLVELMMELVDTYKIRLPKFTVKFAIQYMCRVILKKAKFDISELNTIKVVKGCFIPVLFRHAVEDEFIQPHHSDQIFEAYMGDKNIIRFEGDHNSSRPQFYFNSISIFFNNVLQHPVDEVRGTFFDMPRDYIGRGTWSNIHEMRNSDNLLSAPTVGSTEDAIRELRSKRLVSGTEVPSDIASKDEQSEAQEGVSGSDPNTSSSNMISFELVDGGDLYGPYVPASIDDDEYVEYALDTLSDFPNDVEEEEMMLMEAILESLEDADVQKSSAVEPPQSSKVDDLRDAVTTVTIYAPSNPELLTTLQPTGQVLKH